MKPVAIGTRVFELPGGSREFWEITLDGKATTVTFGRRGAGGRSESNDWASDADARENYEKQIAQQKEKGYVELTSTKAAAPWSPAVSRQLARLEIACQSFYRPRAPRPLGDFASFIRPGRQGWSDVDPEGEVTQAPPAIWGFMKSRQWPPRRFLRTEDGPHDFARMSGGWNYDVVVDGGRRLLVSFAVAPGGNSYLLDLRDRSPDPAVWRAFEETPQTYNPVFSIAYPTLSSFLATLAVDGARPDQMPPWAPAVTAELARLRAVVLPYDPDAPRPVSVGCSFVTDGDSWEDVDPQGEVTEVPPAVYWFLRNVDFRTDSLRLLGDGDEETLKSQRGNENCDVVVDGKRRLLVSFAISETYFYRCLDLCDQSSDPAVWCMDHSDCGSAGVEFKQLSQFLAALRA